MSLRQYVKYSKRKSQSNNDGLRTVALFHPYCNAGGGGERVLWCAVRAIQSKYKNVKVYVYTGDNDATPEQILKKSRNTFNITVDPKRLEFIFLNKRKWVEAEKYPYFTLLGQSLGSIFLGLEALLKFQPGIMCL